MKKKIAIVAAIIACAVSFYFNLPNLQTMKAAAELKEGAHRCYCYAVMELNWDVCYYGE
jgi:uncharacterized membrane protein